MKKDWGNNNDDWLSNRQITGKLTLSQKLCQWLLNKTYPLFFISLGISFFLSSFIPFFVFLGILLVAILYLLIK